MSTSEELLEIQRDLDEVCRKICAEPTIEPLSARARELLDRQGRLLARRASIFSSLIEKPATPSLPRVHLRDGNPLSVLSACKRAAMRAGWSLEQWVEFSASVRACFSDEALPEEVDLMWSVVRSHFAVTTPETTKPEEQTT